MKRSVIVITIVSISIAMLGMICMQGYWISNALSLREERFKKDVAQVLYNTVEKIERYDEMQRYKKISEVIKMMKSTNATPPNVHFEFNLNDTNTVKESIQQLGTQAWGQRNEIVERMMQEMFDMGTATPLQKRISSSAVDSILREELKMHGIDTDYEFAIFDAFRNPVLMKNKATRKFVPDMIRTGYSMRLFPADFLQSPTTLTLFFPHQKGYFFQQMWFMLSVSGILMLIIIWAFYYTISTIVRQKKLSEIKNDFINNMTHEFKTPISTISLACEMLSDNDISATEQQRLNYIGMIRDENKRLGSLVENVLQNAVIERGELKLKTERISMNELISDMAISFDIQVTRRGGNIHLELDAVNDEIEGDRVHITNVIFNLMDNANKYTPDIPQITVRTQNTEADFIVTVTDNGMGISRENQKKIFEKLYRVPSGNVHDVKGFGLGLSYVKAIVEKHNGTISVDSAPGKGSTFKITIPLYGKQN